MRTVFTLGSIMAPRLAPTSAVIPRITSTLAAFPRMASTLAAIPRMAPWPASSLSTYSFDVTHKSLSSIQSPLVGHPESFFTGATSV